MYDSIHVEHSTKLIFSNAGSFCEGKTDDYTLGDKTPTRYRNKWLVEAVVTLNNGIHKIYKSQRQRFFPLPDLIHCFYNVLLNTLYCLSLYL